MAQIGSPLWGRQCVLLTKRFLVFQPAPGGLSMSTYFATICGVRHHPPKGFSRLVEYTLELSCGHYLKAVSNVAPGEQIVCPRCSNLEAVSVPADQSQTQAA